MFCLRKWQNLSHLGYPGVVCTDFCPFQDLLPIHPLDVPGWYYVDVTAVVLPTSLWDVARTYLAAVHVVLNIRKLYIKKPAIWPT